MKRYVSTKPHRYTAMRRDTEGLKRACDHTDLCRKQRGAACFKPSPLDSRGIAAPRTQARRYRIADNLPCLLPSTTRAFKAISLGYFSLGQQRKVTRASAEARNARCVSGNLATSPKQKQPGSLFFGPTKKSNSRLGRGTKRPPRRRQPGDIASTKRQRHRIPAFAGMTAPTTIATASANCPQAE
jgi:hypothetical protein